MKILQLNTYDNKGGAAKASTRLAQSLVQSGIDTSLLVRKKNVNELFIHSANERIARLKPYLDYFPTFVFTRSRMPFFSAMVSDNLLKNVKRFNPDLIHLNWISEGFVKIETLAKLNIPIVWTLHDFWAFTGGCHLPGDCIKFQSGCERCHYLSPKLHHDLSRYNFVRKLKSYHKIENLTIITPSEWLKNQVDSSKLLGERKIEVIPNCLDTKFYHRIPKEKAKIDLGVEIENKIIVFGGVNSTTDKNKGYLLFLEALKGVKIKNLRVLVFGNNWIGVKHINSIEVRFLGKIKDEKVIRNIYSLADVTVVPSYLEAFGQIITESMSCGTPVVAFNHSGPVDIVGHKVNGYLAKAYEIDDLANGIEWVLTDLDRWKKLSANGAAEIRSKFSNEVVANKYVKLYKKILENQK